MWPNISPNLPPALCCHHRCDWGPYVGKKFLEEQGFSETDFQLLSSITSWCTCGSGRPRLRQEEAPLPPELHSPEIEPSSPSEESPPPENGGAINADKRDRYTRLQLDQATREEIGRQAKRVIDWGRLCYLEEVTHLDVKLKYYCDPFISLENALLVCSPSLGNGTTG